MCAGAGTLRPRPASRARVATAAAWMVGLMGCVTLPDVLDPPTAEAPLLLVQRHKVDPPLVVDGHYSNRIFLDPNIDKFRVFSAQAAIDARGLSQPLHYAWYWDYDNPSLPALYYARCPNSLSCPIGVCILAPDTTAQDVHRVLFVVSDRPLPSDAVGPLSFPNGTTYDWVEWQVQLEQGCN